MHKVTYDEYGGVVPDIRVMNGQQRIDENKHILNVLLKNRVRQQGEKGGKLNEIELGR